MCPEIQFNKLYKSHYASIYGVIEMVLFKCGVCGYVFDGAEPPEHCPKCGAPKEKFSKIDEAAEQLILRSRKTNDLHMKANAKLQKLETLADEGIADNLDHPCVAIFTRLKKDCHELRQAIKAEVQGHMNKGKWG
jgi:rubredoxin